MLEFIEIYGMEVLLGILGFIGTALGFIAKNLAKKYLNDKTKIAVAKVCVQFVEQVFKDMHGEEKLFAALERAAAILAEKGIPFSAVEMETLIEAAVAEFNEAFFRLDDFEVSATAPTTK